MSGTTGVISTSRRGVTRHARWIDRIGKQLISVGGFGVIAAVLGILVFIVAETMPLFRGARVEERRRLGLGRTEPVLAAGLDPHQEILFAVRAGGVDFLRPDVEQAWQRWRPQALAGRTVTSAFRSPVDGYLALGRDDGRVLVCRVEFDAVFAEGSRRIEPRFSVDDSVALDPRGEPLTRVAFRRDGDGRSLVAGITASGRLLVAWRQAREGLLGPAQVEQGRSELTEGLQGRPTAVLVDGAGQQLLAGTDQGTVHVWEVGDSGPAQVQSLAAAPPGTAITALAFLIGDVSVAVGDSQGGVSTWARVPNPEGGHRPYQRIHVLRSHPAAVVRIASSERDRQFLTGDAQGGVALHHATTEQTFFQVRSSQAGVTALAMAPKNDGFLLVGEDGELRQYLLDNPHPDITLGALFGAVWYEGYAEPEYVWQSTGGTDANESKLSLVPLVFGTIKGTLYAILFALPLAVLSALYTAEFAPPQVRSLVKPTVEVMASLPSVILGFLAGLWLAPLLEEQVIGSLLLLPVVPAVVVAAAWGWRQLPRRVRIELPGHVELGLLTVSTLLAAWLALVLGPWVEQLLFDGAFPRWLVHTAGLPYEQRNCLVVGFAMGFAVIPLIFTICEDALTSVPGHLRAGSLALGATRWQTAVRVVLPMAVPGIFSATMIGFGRAVGETMIVLMATGNTPIMDWSIFDGMRTISANIAVELPEAPYQGSLYRVLFLTGLLLFASTFVVNTVAELVRQRLREKYSRL